MILLLSQEYEESTNNVIDWLTYYDADYIRCNGDKFDVNDFFFQLSNTHEDNVSSLPVLPKDIKVVWYRRWGNMGGFSLLKDQDLDHEFCISINTHLKHENAKLSHAFFSLFSHSFWLSKPNLYSSDDKFLYLKTAKSVGIHIPETYILNSKAKLQELLMSGKKLITKSMSNAHKIRYNNQTYIPYTEEITLKDLGQFEENFMISLFQEKIEKQYEIRTFFLIDSFYSMAIFSQNDHQTKVDFRKYNFSKPNRCVPYRLPVELRVKLKTLMKKLDINTGSIDILKSKQGKYYFLEINPIGQYGMTSIPCNYHLDKKIAEFLISKNNEQHETGK